MSPSLQRLNDRESRDRRRYVWQAENWLNHHSQRLGVEPEYLLESIRDRGWCEPSDVASLPAADVHKLEHLPAFTAVADAPVMPIVPSGTAAERRRERQVAGELGKGEAA